MKTSQPGPIDGRGCGLHNPIRCGWSHLRPWFQKSNAPGLLHNPEPRQVSNRQSALVTTETGNPATRQLSSDRHRTEPIRATCVAHDLAPHRFHHGLRHVHTCHVECAVHSHVNYVTHRQHHCQYYHQVAHPAHSQIDSPSARSTNDLYTGSGKCREGNGSPPWWHMMRQPCRRTCYETVIRACRKVIPHTVSEALPRPRRCARYFMVWKTMIGVNTSIRRAALQHATVRATPLAC